MHVAKCRFALQSPIRPATKNGTALAAVRAQLYLCRLYDCALAIKAGSPPSQMRFYENRIVRALHTDCAQLTDISAPSANRGCDACALARAIKLLASSDYSGPASDFITSTQGDDAEDLLSRLSRDLSVAFGIYIERASLPADSQRCDLMKRAEALTKGIRDALGSIAAIEHLSGLVAANQDSYPHAQAEKIIFPQWLLSACQNQQEADDGLQVVVERTEQNLAELRGKRLKITITH